MCSRDHANPAAIIKDRSPNLYTSSIIPPLPVLFLLVPKNLIEISDVIMESSLVVLKGLRRIERREKWQMGMSWAGKGRWWGRRGEERIL